VVDDDQDSLDLVHTILASLGAEARECVAASEGLDTVQEWRPHVLICDIEMPGEDGYMFIRKVRALDFTKGGKTPALALTAYGSFDDRVRTLSAGYSMHVSKPVDPAELGSIVGSLAGRSSEA